MARVVMACLFLGITTAIMGETMCKWFGITTPPEMLLKMTQNKLASCMMMWFVCSMLTNMLTSTGAFEISYDGHMVFSKLDSGRMPMIDEVIKNINRLRKM